MHTLKTRRPEQVPLRLNVVSTLVVPWVRRPLRAKSLPPVSRRARASLFLVRERACRLVSRVWVTVFGLTFPRATKRLLLA